MSQGRLLSIIYLSERFVGARKIVRLAQGKNCRKMNFKLLFLLYWKLGTAVVFI